MKRLLSLSRVLTIALCLFGWMQESAGQWSVLLKNQSVLMHSPANFPQAMVNEAPKFAHRQYWILQHSEPLNPKQNADLRTAGIVLGVSLSPQCRVAGLPVGLPIENIQNFGFQGIAPFQSKLTYGPEMIWAFQRVAANASIQMQVLPHAGLKEDFITHNWKPSWGVLQSVWSGRLSKWLVLCTLSQIDSLSHAGWVQWMEPADGELVPFNGEATAHGRINCLKSSGFGWNTGLDGTGVTLAIGDGGRVDAHADLESHQENLTPNRIPTFGNHADHVTGTVGGSGLLQADKQGMAPGARMLNAQTSSVISTGAALRIDEQVVLTNNSYGIAYSCSRAGNYSATSAFIDDQLLAYPDLLHVFAAGNQGYLNCGSYPTGFKTIADGYPVSKNVLTVGATLSKDEFAWFSSAGPARDGRVKPEIVADGNDLNSTVPTDTYEKKSGTSMATPVVTGTLALLVQRYRELNAGQNPESALLKGLLCNTAEDLGLPHVDFTYGFGRLNGRRARQVLENHRYQSGSISSNTVSTLSLQAPANAKSLKVMLVWADEAGAVGGSKALVNDLDLKVFGGNSIEYLPWVMNALPGGVAQAAQRSLDTLNNIEQVTLDVSGSENISVEVKSGMLAGLHQKYWLVYDWIVPELVITYPANNQKVRSNGLLPIRWDLDALHLNSLFLEISTDSGQTWNTVSTLSKPDSLYAEWQVPAVDFETYWIRLSGQSGSTSIQSNIVKVSSSAPPQVTIETCNQTLRINWNSMLSASRYEVLLLDREAGKWMSKGFSTCSSFLLNGLENGKPAAISVKAWKGTRSGIQSDAVFGTPNPGICPWAKDLGITQMSAPQSGRRFTSTDPGTSALLQIDVQNFGNQDITNESVRVYFKDPSGVVSHSDQIFSIPAGGHQVLTLPWMLAMPAPAVYALRFWLQWVDDTNPGNDTLFQMLEVLDNPAIILPWQFNAENLGVVGLDLQLTSSEMGVSNAPGLDFISNEKARLKTDLLSAPAYYGAKSLVLDKQKMDGTTGTGELIFTLNLENYPGAGRLYLDFDFLSFGPLDPGNVLLVRANDQNPWVEVIRFDMESYQPGQVKNYRVLDLAPYLVGQIFSSSFQIKFSQSGLKPSTLSNAGGYAVDNLMLSFPSKDVSICKLLGPVNSCQNASAQKVKLRLQNHSAASHHHVKVGYQLPGQLPVVEEIEDMLSGDTVDYEFTTTLEPQTIGKLDFKVWVTANDDGYPGNDTLRNQVVFIAPNISVYPYYQGFEAGEGYWESYGEKNSWGWGVPSKSLTVVDTAANGTKIWSTGLTTSYGPNQLSYLQSPCFNLSDIQTNVQFSFNSVFSTEQDYDYAWLEISEDGVNWTKVGAMDNGTNWYNHASNQWNGLRPHWEVSSIPISLTGLTDRSKVRFRFGFSSDASIVSEGFGLDDVHLEPAFKIVDDTSFAQTLTQDFTQTWTEFGPQPDKLVSVENSALLGSVSLKVKRNQGMIRYQDNVPYLDRNFLLKPANQPNGPVKVRLYITDAEVKKLADADIKMNSFQQLGIFKYDGANEDLNLANNLSTSASDQYIPAAQVQKVPTAGGYFLEFTVNSFSEFYIATQSLSGPDDPLAVRMLSFSAKPAQQNHQVNVDWLTASEQDANRFELSYSCDGEFFEPIYSVKASGSASSGHGYHFTHQPGACSSSSLIYKLLQFDNGSSKPMESRAVCANPTLDLQKIWTANPMTERLEVHGLAPNSTLLLTDALGKIWMKASSEKSEFEYDIARLPKGSYWLKVHSEAGQKALGLVKF